MFALQPTVSVFLLWRNMKMSKVFVLGLDMHMQMKEVEPARVELLNSGIQNKTDALRAWSHRGWQKKVFLCSNHYVAVGFNVLFNAPERLLCHRDPELIPRAYLFTWNPNCCCFCLWLCWFSQATAKQVSYTLPFPNWEIILITTKMNFKVIIFFKEAKIHCSEVTVRCL